MLAAMGMAAWDEPQLQGRVTGRGSHPHAALWAQDKPFPTGVIPVMLAHTCGWLFYFQPVPISLAQSWGGISVPVHSGLSGCLNKSTTH